MTASNAAGAATFGVVITVTAAPAVPPSGLSYPSPQTYTAGVPIAPLSPTVSGTVTSYSVAPALPAGLVLNTVSGQIAGTPSSVTVQATYTVTASNAAGDTSFALSIRVEAAALYTIGGTVTGLTGSGIVLTNNGADDLSLASDGAFAFPSALPGGASYVVEVAVQPSSGRLCTVTNAVGTVGNGHVDDIAVECAEPGWGTARKLAPEVGFAGSAEITMFPEGSGIVNWWTYTSNTQRRGPIFVQRYAVAGGWGAPEQIADGTRNSTYRLAASRDGRLIIANWMLDTDVFVRVYAEGSGWGQAQLLVPSGRIVSTPRIVIADSDHAVAVWYDVTSTAGDVYARSYAPGSGWGTAEVISSASGHIGGFDVTVDAAGTVMVVFSQLPDGGDTSVYVASMPAGGDWGAPVLLESSALNILSPRIASGPAGSAIAVWHQIELESPTEGSMSTYASRHSSGTGWQAPELVSGAGSFTSDPRIVMDSSGNAIVVWLESPFIGGGGISVHARRYVSGAGWASAQRIDAPGVLNEAIGDNISRPEAAIGGNGAAFVVWMLVRQDFGGARVSQIWANNYTPTVGWSVAEEISAGATTWAEAPQVAVDALGRATGVWHQWPSFHSTDGAEVWSNRFD